MELLLIQRTIHVILLNNTKWLSPPPKRERAFYNMVGASSQEKVPWIGTEYYRTIVRIRVFGVHLKNIFMHLFQSDGLIDWSMIISNSDNDPDNLDAQKSQMIPICITKVVNDILLKMDGIILNWCCCHCCCIAHLHIILDTWVILVYEIILCNFSFKITFWCIVVFISINYQKYQIYKLFSKIRFY